MNVGLFSPPVIKHIRTEECISSRCFQPEISSLSELHSILRISCGYFCDTISATDFATLFAERHAERKEPKVQGIELKNSFLDVLHTVVGRHQFLVLWKQSEKKKWEKEKQTQPRLNIFTLVCNKIRGNAKKKRKTHPDETPWQTRAWKITSNLHNFVSLSDIYSSRATDSKKKIKNQTLSAKCGGYWLIRFWCRSDFDYKSVDAVESHKREITALGS